MATLMGNATRNRDNAQPFEFDRETPSILANREAECSLCQLALTIGSEAIETLRPVEPGDFYWEDTRFIFCEVLAMIEAGYPTGDKASLKSWFNSPEIIERLYEAKLDDWVSKTGSPEFWPRIMEIFIEPNVAGVLHVSAAHIDFYISELKKWRAVRWLRLFGFEVVDRIEGKPSEVEATTAWALDQLQKFLAKVNENGKETTGQKASK